MYPQTLGNDLDIMKTCFLALIQEPGACVCVWGGGLMVSLWYLLLFWMHVLKQIILGSKLFTYKNEPGDAVSAGCYTGSPNAKLSKTEHPTLPPDMFLPRLSYSGN